MRPPRTFAPWRPRAAASRAVRAGAALMALAAAALLSGCAGEQEELSQWMEQQRREVRPSVQPLQAPKKFNPEPYTMAQAAEPFSAQKLSVALRQEARQPNSAVAAELNRRREPLESYPLDGMTMVGSVVRDGRPHALLKIENLLYQVRVGDYIGQNFGRITGINETEIALREIVQDAAGEWIERPATLQLQAQAAR
jgi:type IV pilus assembly protein PilP